MTRTIIRIVDQRKSGALVVILECGHRKLIKRWSGRMQEVCDSCLAGMKPQPIPKGEIVQRRTDTVQVRMGK
jgi:hypothetical protein